MSLGDFFKSEEQLENERLQKEKEKFEEEKRRQRALQELAIEEALSKVIFFPGDQDMFELFIGFPVKIIDFGNRDKGILFIKYRDDKGFVCMGSNEEKKRIVEVGVIALISCSIGSNQSYRYGIPVAKYVDDQSGVPEKSQEQEF